MIYVFFTAKMSKFSEKKNAYRKVDLILLDEPLAMVGMYVLCFDAAMPFIPVTACIAFEDKATGHRPEDGNVEGKALVAELERFGLTALGFEANMD